MNLIVGTPSWLIAVLILALLAAAIEDAVRLRISNLTCAVVALAAIVAAAMHGFSPSLWQNAVVFIALLAAGTGAFAAGWMGGGDVKLFAAAGLWFTLSSAVALITAVFLAGGVVALISIVIRRLVRRDQSTKARSGRIPYGLAITAGAAFVIAVQLNSRPTNPFIERMRAAEAANRSAG
jgi:prepilin peptidase CpaA